MHPAPPRPRSTLLAIALLWLAFYASFTLFTPALLDDADSVHAEVAREMLLRHDFVTLYANGIRYLEKAPLLYWSMAACMRLAQLLGHRSPQALAVAARMPLAFTMLALALLVEAFARRAFQSIRAGLYAALITLSSFGFFLFSRITLPDVMVCLWITLALYAFWRTEALDPATGPAHIRRHCLLFAAACALNVLSKGLIGIVFPVAIVLLYLLFTRGFRGAVRRLRELHPMTSLGIFLLIAAPWHILAGLANPTQGHPAPFVFAHGHWQVPLPTDGNVRGWFWFYFMNEHVLRYLNLRVPRDYDTVPLWLFWGLCLVWLMPWSAFVFHAATSRLRSLRRGLRGNLTPDDATHLLLLLWAALPLLFFSLSTRQEYYVLPALPAWALLVAGCLLPERYIFYAAAKDSPRPDPATLLSSSRHQAHLRIATVLFFLGSLFSLVCAFFFLHTRAPQPNTDLAQLLQQNPGDYALSMGHFLDLNAQALGLFRLPLALAGLSLFGGTLSHFLLCRRTRPHAATLALAAGAFGFLCAAHLGLRTFAPVLTSAHLAASIAPQVHLDDLVCIHGEYESGSTLGFYLQRADLHILEGRSSNLWYGSFFSDAPRIFETNESLAAKWRGPQRIFLWQSTTAEPRSLPPLSGPIYVVVTGGGKEILSNQPNR